MKLSSVILLSVLSSFAVAVAGGKVISLTDDNYERLTEGKTVFIKYFAPWCGYCKAIADDWEKLASDYDGNPVGLVAEVDCTTEDSMELCSDVEGFPTLKWGDPDSLEEYDGDRDYNSFVEFAKDNLKPMCGLSNIDLCDDEIKAAIKKFQDMTPEILDHTFNTVLTKIEDTEHEIAEKIEDLESQINDLIDEFELEKKKIKTDSYFNYMMAVVKSRSDEMPIPDDDDFDEDDFDDEMMMPDEL